MPESEKVTINLGAVDLGKIDLLVQEGLYSNRTDFIRAAIRSQVEKHHLEVEQSVARHSFVIGAVWYHRKHLERLRAEGKRLAISVIGMLGFYKDVPADLVSAVIETVQLRGVLRASDSVKTALADRMQ